ncbi:UNVERIFIED_CONTAM: hypothetical protein K2H54_004020 [Gekko kuhli]
MAEEMLQHHVMGEEACQESMGEGAVERLLGWDTPEEVWPLLSQSLGETLQCRANELQQRDQGGEEEAPRDSRKRAAEGDADEASASGSPEDFWLPRGEKHPVPLEVVVTVVDSLYSLQSVAQRAGSPPNPEPGSPKEGGSLAHDSCHLTEDEDLPRDSPVSTGYYPCFCTCSHLPPEQPGEREAPPEHPGKVDASTQAGGTQHDKASQWEADPSGEEARTKPRPGKRSLLPSPEQASEGESKVPMARKGGMKATLATSCPPGSTSSHHAINQLLRSSLTHIATEAWDNSKTSQVQRGKAGHSPQSPTGVHPNNPAISTVRGASPKGGPRIALACLRPEMPIHTSLPPQLSLEVDRITEI